MALLDILRYPDPRLHKIAKPVTVFDERLKQLVADMADTMYEAPGVGLAATQVDVHEQVIVIDVSDSGKELRVLINPEIIWSSEEKLVYDEGCLSVPGIYDGVERPARVKARALDADGKAFEVEADGLLAVCIPSRVRCSLNICRRSNVIASRPSCKRKSANSSTNAVDQPVAGALANALTTAISGRHHTVVPAFFTSQRATKRYT